MAKYIAFASYTPEAWAHIISEGVDREASIREIIERADGHLEMVYWLFSKHDLVGVFEIPDDVDAIALRYTAYSSGHLREIEFHPVVSQSATADMQRRAKEFKSTFKHATHPQAHRHS
jgi:uncharacterized protein with GYD domain